MLNLYQKFWEAPLYFSGDMAELLRSLHFRRRICYVYKHTYPGPGPLDVKEWRELKQKS